MKMKWEKSRIDIYNIGSADAILSPSTEAPDEDNDDTRPEPEWP